MGAQVDLNVFLVVTLGTASCGRVPVSRHAFSSAERAAVYRAIEQRRDMRHFLPDPVDPAVLQRLLQAAHHAPSVGLMQPWRIIRVTDPDRRRKLQQLVAQERLATAEALEDRSDEFMKLKVEGLSECAEVLVMALMDQRERHLFGRRTLPQMDLASVSCAIQNLWLAARAEGLGMGWVSLFEPQALAALLEMPEGAEPVAILCLGHVETFYDRPMLEQQGWAEGQPLAALYWQNRWGGSE